MYRVVFAVLLLVAACGDDGTGSAPAASAAPDDTSTSSAAPTTTAAQSATPAPTSAIDGCAHVIAGEIVWQGDAATVSATVRSADTGWDKYADAWEVRSPDGVVLGVRELAHPHETEQPFTRSLNGVAIPQDLGEVVLAAHDSVDGWCGDTLVVPVPDRP